MATLHVPGRLDHLTFKGNLKRARYGWLRLTPAYSVHLVSELLDVYGWHDSTTVLDPFCGTGTTALVCAERGIPCDTTDINPFLQWLAYAKTFAYSDDDIDAVVATSERVTHAISAIDRATQWLPSIHDIKKWWDDATLDRLGRAMDEIRAITTEVGEPAANLLRVAFCRTMIEHANVSFGHQSMSFKKRHDRPMAMSLFSDEDSIISTWQESVSTIAASARSAVYCQPRVLLCDARNLTALLATNSYTCVITSPPYPNRMSYIRELRPYMYWLGYLNSGREAGELDWQAIGGTWGCATSNLSRWMQDGHISIPFVNFDAILAGIAAHSPLLSRYVQKYFHDMVLHCAELVRVVKPGGTIHYIVGNSKFYDVLLPVEQIYAALFQEAGLEDVDVRTIRKRTSKKELYEYVVSARKPVTG